MRTLYLLAEPVTYPISRQQYLIIDFEINRQAVQKSDEVSCRLTVFRAVTKENFWFRENFWSRQFHHGHASCRDSKCEIPNSGS